LTAVWVREVVAPPISSGMVRLSRSISRALCAIFSSEGVIRPENPMMSRVRPLRLENLFPRHHHAEIDHLVIIALEHDRNDVLPISCTSP